MVKDNLLIIGGCHVINDKFINEIKNFYKIKSIKKFFTHIPDDNFEKVISILIKDKDIFEKNYNIIIQIGNLHYHNSIINLIPNKIRGKIIKNISFENSISEVKNYSDDRITPKFNLKILIREILKVLVFPINLFYVPIKGFFVFYKIKRVFKNNYSKSKIIIFTPMKTLNNIDNFLKMIGVKTIKKIFKNVSNVRVFNFYNLEYIPKFYSDTYHLNDEGINYYLTMFKKQNLLID